MHQQAMPALTARQQALRVGGLARLPDQPQGYPVVDVMLATHDHASNQKGGIRRTVLE